MTLTVILQEPRRLVVEGTAKLLESNADAQVVLAVTDPAELVDRNAPKADVAILSIETETPLLLRTVRALRRRQRDMRVIGTFRRAAWAPTESEAYRHLAAVVAHEEGTAALLTAICGEGGSAPSIRRFRENAGESRPPALTQRERDVLTLLAGGCSAQEASDRLQISRKTVENHKQRMFSKLGVQSQAHAVARAMRSGVLPLPAPLPASLSG
jgi:DNA-binding NarL/FixJ family response regulator